jgi:predicted ester cyclase
LNTEKNKDLVRRQFQLISEGDAKGAAALYAPVSRNHGREVKREDIAQVLESLVTLQERFTINEIVAEGEWVACRAIVTGKHDAQPRIPVDSGIYSFVKPAGQPYTFQHMHLFKVVGGQIVEHWANRDDLGAARQLGLELSSARKARSQEAF